MTKRDFHLTPKHLEFHTNQVPLEMVEEEDI